MGWESFGMVIFDLGPLIQGQTRIAKLKMLIPRLLLVVQVWDGKPSYRKSWAENLFEWSYLTLGPLQGQMTIAKLKSADNLLIIGLRGLQYETSL